ncbi:MAG: hypothetical protein Q8M07_11675 [Prosthecobacter sp.]|nr:hypothetical protein [Prosthecobacter sp.]
MSQPASFLFFLVLSAIVIAAFVFVARSTRDPAEVPYEAVAGMRQRLFWVMSLALLAFLGLTLPLLPYAHADQRPDRVVHVRARQFLFEFADEAFPADGGFAMPKALAPVKAGELVEYRVSAVDATHGFAIYNSKGHLIHQVQAMPGYVNRLRVRFPEAGTYNVLCLEYCGVGHHVMRAAIDVAAN